MNKKSLQEILGLDSEIAKRIEQVPSSVDLLTFFKMVEPHINWDKWEQDGRPYLEDSYVTNWLGKCIVYGALVDKYGNKIPNYDVDYAYFDDNEYEFTKLGYLYDEVFQNIENAKNEPDSHRWY